MFGTLHKSERLVRSIAAAEIITVAEEIDEGAILKQTYPIVLGFTFDLIVALVSKYLY